MKYPNVWPPVLISNERPKLVLGMLSFNALLTSSTRLSQFEPPTVGATTTNFSLNSIGNLLATRTYFDQKSVDKVLELANNEETISIINNRFVGQLQRLNTKFDCPFTNYFCRTSALVTQSHQSYPYSIFTLANFDKVQNSAAVLFLISPPTYSNMVKMIY